MRILLKVSVPVESGNKALKDGTLPKTMMGFIEKHKPEASYFTAEGGKRTAFFFVDLKDTSDIPSMAEPFFQNLHASIEFAPTMNLADLQAGIEKAMKNA